MSAWWHKRRGVRGLIGFLASQIIVLQFLFAGIVSTEMAVQASPDAFAICHNDSESASGQPGKAGANLNHASCIICAFAAHASPLPDDPPCTVVFDVRISVMASATPLVISTTHFRSPRTSQGPPLSA